MNNTKMINEIDFYPNQRRSFLDFGERLNRTDMEDNHALDTAIDDMRDFFSRTAGAKLDVLINIHDYLINHKEMEHRLALGLQNYGMSGASEFDNEILATQMLDFSPREYNRKYFISPHFGRLGNLNVNEGKVVRAIWQDALTALVKRYGTKKSPQFSGKA